MRSTLSMVLCGLFLSACNTTPSVKYQAFNSRTPDMEGFQKFNLTRTQILITYAQPAPDTGLQLFAAQPSNQKTQSKDQANKNNKTDNSAGSSDKSSPSNIDITSDWFTITVAPVPDPSSRFGVKDGGNKWFQSTQIVVTNYPDLDLFQSASVEYIDNTARTLGEVAKVVAGANSFFSLSGKPKQADAAIPKRIRIDASDDVLNQSANGDKVSRSYKFDDGTTEVELAVDAVPNDAVQANVDLEKLKSLWFYSACRNAHIDIISSGKLIASKSFRIADPRFLQTVALPLKGKITANAQCGVTVATEASSTADGIAQLAEDLQAAKAIFDAAKGKAAAAPSGAASGAKAGNK